MVKNLFNILFLASLLVVLNSCEEEKVTHNSTSVEDEALSKQMDEDFQNTKFYEMEFAPNELVGWVSQKENSILCKTKKISEFNYSVKYLPIDYLISNELKKENIAKKEYDSLRVDYEGMEYFELRIQIDDFNDETAKYQLDDMGLYQQRIVYMSFAMQNNLWLLTDLGDKIPCDLFHFERTYAVAPYATFLMGFAKDKIGAAKEYTIIFEDNLFNKGILKFHWEISQLQNVPQLLISK